MAKVKKEIGLAIIGCGVIGRLRAILAHNHPGVAWIGVCDIKENLAKKLAEDIDADFVTTDYKELIKRPEVSAVIIATDENYHTGPTLCAVEYGRAIFIEKPLATDIKESLSVLNAVEQNGIDAVVGYTNRFRRRYLAVKERVRTGQIGNVTALVTRALMNRMVPIATTRRTEQKEHLTPMVVSGTHSLDLSMWMLEGKKPVSVYARSTDKALSKYGTKDATFGIFTMDDGTIFSMNISWALPIVWPGGTYGIEIGIVGDKGVIDIEDTHRDLVLASEIPQGATYKPDGFTPEYQRHVDFLTSYPPGDYCQDQFWGPLREENNTWLSYLCTGVKGPHATVADAHRNLMLGWAMDLSSKTGKEIKLPISIDEFYK